MHTSVNALFEALWQHYLAVTPSALKIHQLLGGGEAIVNDHVAFRTFNHPRLGLDKLAAHFLALGYEQKGEYHFEAKKLYARHYEHPDPTVPKVFISELLLEQCSPELQRIVAGLVAQVDDGLTAREDFLYSGAPWRLCYADYQTLAAESEYAGWLAAYGYRANHFTVSVNHLKDYDSLEAVNSALKQAGFRLNDAGGEIKGSPGVLLEQSSTLADTALVQFTDGEAALPSCFYEFALRYPKPDGELYTGFVAASADRIFESTDAGRG
ncbi:DUF1338 domain-containing protein [Oceanimonas pelagia]|uniref:2-oxoadipate dioxygenase/decarboxylase n=1 Tax=Oceanimonas pelagia TaxID=3028314 RepID=A0AA50KQJ0_9GAMM|nr:DUF1338 domain-containing protein [Oceanimonas pelagia]WMC11240.1 DUF1338 domain-containing protein [Oceanimonas pelagia]